LEKEGEARRGGGDPTARHRKGQSGWGWVEDRLHKTHREGKNVYASRSISLSNGKEGANSGWAENRREKRAKVPKGIITCSFINSQNSQPNGRCDLKTGKNPAESPTRERKNSCRVAGFLTRVEHVKQGACQEKPKQQQKK